MLLLACLILFILFFVLFGVTSESKAGTKASSNDGATTQSKDESASPANGMPVEQKLAVLDASGYVAPSDAKVARIKTLLNDLTSKYNQPADTIAEYTSKAQGVLHDSGIDNTPYRDAITVFLMLKVKAAGNK